MHPLPKFGTVATFTINWSNLPADAVPTNGTPGLATATSHTPSLWPFSSFTTLQHTVVVLKLDTILDVCAFNLCAVFSFCEEPATEIEKNEIKIMYLIKLKF